MGYQIIVKGLAETEYEGNLEDLDGIDCQDNFVDYIDNGDIQEKLEKYAYMQFEVKDGKLYTVVHFEATEELDSSELAYLLRYTEGQLSDGIGESFEQFPCHYDDKGTEVYISPWARGTSFTITQIKHG